MSQKTARASPQTELSLNKWKPPKRPSDLTGHHIVTVEKFVRSDGPIQYLGLLHDKKLETKNAERILQKRLRDTEATAGPKVSHSTNKNSNGTSKNETRSDLASDAMISKTASSVVLDKVFECLRASALFFTRTAKAASNALVVPDVLSAKFKHIFSLVFSYKTLAVIPILFVLFGAYKIGVNFLAQDERSPASVAPANSGSNNTSPAAQQSRAENQSQSSETPTSTPNSELGSGKHKIQRATGSVSEWQSPAAADHGANNTNDRSNTPEVSPHNDSAREPVQTISAYPKDAVEQTEVNDGAVPERDFVTPPPQEAIQLTPGQLEQQDQQNGFTPDQVPQQPYDMQSGSNPPYEESNAFDANGQANVEGTIQGNPSPSQPQAIPAEQNNSSF